MTVANEDPGNIRSGAIAWLVRVNAEVSQWAASMAWWRLSVLFLVLLIAGSIIGDLLHLKHERVRVAGPHKDLAVTIGGRDGIRITTIPKSADTPAPVVPPMPPVPGDSQPPGTGAKPPDAATPVVSGPAATNAAARDEVDDEDVQASANERVVTLRGSLGDLGGVVLVVLFAYLAASKIVVRKVAQADAKVRTAVDAAEREAMERQLVQARLQVLQAQVEPHFLFNTLAAVDYLIETEPPRASQMQKALITYLRGALPQMREQSSTLGREMRLIRSYLDLIKMRIEDRLQIEIAVPESLENAEFPPMMLQSLVENAVKHGIEPKTEGGRIRVAANTAGNQLWVEVSDTGVGVPDGEMFEAPMSGTGIGLRNIRERLSMLYPGKSRLLLRSDPTTGTVVKISVPLRLAKPLEDPMPPEVAGTVA
jgi:signal transduction histidine kinase